MADLPKAYISHKSPGRLRIRIPERRRDAAYFAAVRQRLSDWEGVEHVEVNPATAGVLVLHNGGFFDQQATNDLFALVEPFEIEVEIKPLILRAKQKVKDFDAILRQLAGGHADLRTLVFLGLIVAGVGQLRKGNVTAPATTLFWYAGDMLGLWREFDRRLIDLVEGGQNAEERA